MGVKDEDDDPGSVLGRMFGCFFPKRASRVPGHLRVREDKGGQFKSPRPREGSVQPGQLLTAEVFLALASRVTIIPLRELENELPFRYALAAAVIADLVSSGRMTIRQSMMRRKELGFSLLPVGTRPTSIQYLDETLSAVTKAHAMNSAGTQLEEWLMALGEVIDSKTRTPLLSELIAETVLSPDVYDEPGLKLRAMDQIEAFPDRVQHLLGEVDGVMSGGLMRDGGKGHLEVSEGTLHALVLASVTPVSSTSGAQSILDCCSLAAQSSSLPKVRKLLERESSLPLVKALRRVFQEARAESSASNKQLIKARTLTLAMSDFDSSILPHTGAHTPTTPGAAHAPRRRVLVDPSGQVLGTAASRAVSAKGTEETRHRNTSQPPTHPPNRHRSLSPGIREPSVEPAYYRSRDSSFDGRGSPFSPRSGASTPGGGCKTPGYPSNKGAVNSNKGNTETTEPRSPQPGASREASRRGSLVEERDATRTAYLSLQAPTLELPDRPRTPQRRPTVQGNPSIAEERDREQAFRNRRSSTPMAAAVPYVPAATGMASQSAYDSHGRSVSAQHQQQNSHQPSVRFDPLAGGLTVPSAPRPNSRHSNRSRSASPQPPLHHEDIEVSVNVGRPSRRQ